MHLEFGTKSIDDFPWVGTSTTDQIEGLDRVLVLCRTSIDRSWIIPVRRFLQSPYRSILLIKQILGTL
jgi:hypothetical protein